MSKFDDAVERELEANRVSRSNAEAIGLEKLQHERNLLEAFAQRIRQVVDTERLTVTIAPTRGGLHRFANLAIDIDHPKTDTMLGTVLVLPLPEFGDDDSHLPHSDQKTITAYFFESELQSGFEDFASCYSAAHSQDVLDHQLDEARFLEKLFEELVSSTVIIEEEAAE